jgi:hypothetical protein
MNEKKVKIVSFIMDSKIMNFAEMNAEIMEFLILIIGW